MRPRGRASRELGHVYWIGGGSAAGKSTIARHLASRHGLQVHASDDAMSDHARRSSAQDAPLLHRFMAMDMDERWIGRSPAAMLETFHWFRGECFAMIVRDLLRLRRDPAVIAEGFRLLPRLVAPLLTGPGRAVWLLPTPGFREAVFERRGPAWGFLSKTSDPAKALANLLERDRMFTEHLREETQRLELPTIDVDAGVSEEELAGRVADTFGL